MIHLVISSKGSSGKTTIAQQCIAPYLFFAINEYAPHPDFPHVPAKKVLIMEWGTTNTTSKINSSILNTVSYGLNDGANALRSKIFNYIGPESEELIIDAGAGVESMEALGQMVDPRLSDQIVYHIPMVLNPQELKKLSDTISGVKEQTPNAKIMIYINKLGTLQEPVDNYKENLPGEMKKYFESLKKDRKIGITTVPYEEFFIEGVPSKNILFDIWLMKSSAEEYLMNNAKENMTQEENDNMFKVIKYLKRSPYILAYLRDYVFEPLDDLLGITFEDHVARSKMYEKDDGTRTEKVAL